MKTAKRNERLAFISFVFCVLVLFLHSYNIDFYGSGSEKLLKVAGRIEYFLSETLGRLAVPGFFLLSAFWFYRNFDFSKLLPRWKSRVVTVLLPYLIWNTLYFLLYLLASGLPGVSELIEKSVDLSGKGILDAVIFYAYNPVYWYLFQLILLILLAPVVYLLCRNLWVGLVAFTGCLILIGFQKDLPVLNLDALTYYLLGAILGKHLPERMISGEGKMGVKISVFLLRIFAAVGSSQWFLKSPGPLPTVMFRLFGALAVITGIYCLPEMKTRPWMRNTFLIYTIQLPLIRLFNKLAVGSGIDRVEWGLVIYFLMPVLVIAIAFLFAEILEKISPRMKKILSGGR